MSDYLATLAAKMLNLTEVVQPRLASFFEPQGASGSVADDDFGLETVLDEQFADNRALLPSATTPRQPQHMIESRRSMPDTRMSPEAVQPDSADDTSARQSPSPSTRQGPSLLIVPQASATSPGQRPTAPGPNPAQPPLPQPSDSSVSPPRLDQHEGLPGELEHDHRAVPSRRAGVPGHPSAPAQYSQPVVATPSAARPATPSPRILHTASADLPSTRDTTPATRDTTPATVVGQPHVAPPDVEPRVPAPAPIASLTTPAPMPTIRVTIGRLEVRAIMPPAPQKPPVTQGQRAPLLTLDEYLKQRNEGRS